MKKKFISTLFILMAVLFLTPALAWAGEPGETWKEVDTLDGLVNALNTDGNIKLTDNIEVDNNKVLNITNDTVLDLNGFTINNTYYALNHFFITIKGGSLTVTDSSQKQTGKINIEKAYGIQLSGTDSAFTLERGTIHCEENETLDIYDYSKNAIININGGKISSTKDNAIGIRGTNTVVNITDGEIYSQKGRCGLYVSTYDSEGIKIKMTGGKIIFDGGASGAIQMYKGAEMTIGGDAEIISNSSYCIQAQSETTLNITGNAKLTSNGNSNAISADDKSIVNVDGGTIHSENSAAIRGEEDSQINIKGGNISSASKSQSTIRAMNNTVVKVEGGNFITNSSKGVFEKYAYYGDTNNSEITVIGGTFNSDQDLENYIPEGMTSDTDNDGNIIIKIDEEKAVAKIGTVGYTDLATAIAEAKDGETIELLKSFTITDAINITDAKTINIEGKNQTITYDVYNPKTVFTGKDNQNLEGIPAGTILNIKNVVFENTSTTNTSAGYAVLVGFNSHGTQVNFDGCTFKNLYTAVYANPIVTEGEGFDISIQNSIYQNTRYGYSIDESTNGAYVGKVDVNFDKKTNTIDEVFTEKENLSPAITVTHNGVVKSYSSWDTAINAAENDDIITLYTDLTQPITINKTITLEGNDHKVSVDNGIAVNVTADGVVINKLNATSKTGYGLIAGDNAAPVKGITINGGSYQTGTENLGLQGEGAIRIWSSGDVTVTKVETIGGIHLLQADGNVTVTDNVVDFTYKGDTPFVGILLLKQTGDNQTANTLLANNTISVPNTASDYVQVGANWGDESKVPANESIAKIDDSYYNTLADAIKAVKDNDTIVLIKNCDEDIKIAKEVTFTLDKGENTFTGSIKADTGYRLTENNGVYEVKVYNKPSGGGNTQDKYSVSVSQNITGGTVTVSPTTAAKDDTVTITTKANEGYELNTITVTDANGKEIKLTDKGNGVYTFTMPSANVTVKSTFKEVQVSELPFTDVAKDAWYYNSVKYVYENDMMKGTEDTLFSPNTSITRGMIVTILYRLEQQPAVTADKLFADVADDAYYSKAIAWAAANDIVAGYDNGNFGPNDTITREQLAAILYRYANYKGYDVSAKADLTKYPDYNQISSYAVNTMTWANAEGLIGGTDKGTLDPKGDASRAQAATILMRFCENVAK